jgi:uncharacterized protein (TIGR00251 family)
MGHGTRHQRLTNLVLQKPAYETDQGTVLLIHAQPKASHTEFAGRHGDALKIRIAAAPSAGAANEELRRFLADRFRLPLAKVQLLSGGQSRHKRMLLKDTTLEHVRQVLDRVLAPDTR